MPLIKESITIASSSERVYQLIKAVEDYPRFIPSIKAVKIVDSLADNTVISEWDAEIDGIPFHWIERDEYDPEAYSARYQMIEGDMEQFDGQWRIKTDQGQINLELTVNYSLGVPSLEELAGLVMHQSLIVSAQELLTGIKRESEVG